MGKTSNNIGTITLWGISEEPKLSLFSSSNWFNFSDRVQNKVQLYL